MIKACQPLFNNKTGALFDIFFTGNIYLTTVHNKDNVKQVRRTAGLNDAECEAKCRLRVSPEVRSGVLNWVVQDK